MADADQAPGQDVEEKAPQELITGDGHHLLLAAMGIVLSAERDVVAGEAYEAVVGDGDTMRIPFPGVNLYSTRSVMFKELAPLLSERSPSSPLRLEKAIESM